jgi:hypothetical protein
MEGVQSRHCELLAQYGQRLSSLGIDQLEQIMATMRDRREAWGNDYSFAFVQEVKSRGHDIDYSQYKIIYHTK